MSQKPKSDIHMWIKKYGMPIFLLYIITSSIFLIFFTTIHFQSSKNHLRREIIFSLRGQMAQLKADLSAVDGVDRDFDINLGTNTKINIYDISTKNYLVNEFDEPTNTKIWRPKGHFEQNFNELDMGDNADKFEKSQDKKVSDGDNFSTKKPDQKRVKFRQKAKIDMLSSGRVVLSDDAIYLFDISGHAQHGFSHQKDGAKSYKIALQDTTYADAVKKLTIKVVIVGILVFLLFILISYFIIRLSFRPLVEKINSLNSFITDATHEINTPLSVILMSVEMFENSPQKYLANIKTASKTLSSVYDDLVRLNLKSEPNIISNLDVKAKICERISYFDVMISAKNLTIGSNLNELFLQTDIFKFEKIFDNLLSNAIKYSDENSKITVTLDAKTMAIKNIGKGIDRQNIAKIYDKFSRFDSQNGGFGIGLSIVKKYIDELGFKINCKSDGKITEFVVKFN